MNRELLRGVEFLNAEIRNRRPLSLASPRIEPHRAERSPFIPSFILTAAIQISRLAPDLAPALDGAKRILAARLAAAIEAGGMIRFFGPGDRIDPDCDTIACVAAALVLEGTLRSSQNDVLGPFRESNGLYASYVSASGARYTWIEDGGKTVRGIDRTVQANLLFYRAICSCKDSPLLNFLLQDLTWKNPLNGSRDYPYPLAYPYCAARALGMTGLPVPRNALHQISAWLEEGTKGLDDLSLALGLSLLSLPGMRKTTAKAYATALLKRQQPSGGWEAASFFVGEFRSQALTTAESLLALLRYRHRGTGNPPDIVRSTRTSG